MFTGGLGGECLYRRGAVGVGLAWSEYVSLRSRKMVEGVDFAGDGLTSKEGEVLGRDSTAESSCTLYDAMFRIFDEVGDIVVGQASDRVEGKRMSKSEMPTSSLVAVYLG